MITPFFFGFILLSFALVWLFLSYIGSSTIRTTTDYFLASKQLGIASISLTLLATQIGGGFLSGIAQESYKNGLFGILYALGISFGFILLSLGVAGRLRSLHIRTTAEIFERVYQSNLLKRLASLIFIGSLWGILIAQMVAFKTIILGVGITSSFFTALFWLLIIAHTMIGGLKAVVTIDTLKQIFIMTLFTGIYLTTISQIPLSGFSLDTLLNIQSHFTLNTTHIWSVLSTFLMPSLFCLIEQDLAQCFFAARGRFEAAVAAILAAFFLVSFSTAPVFFGMQTRLQGLIVPWGANPLTIFLQHYCTPFIFVLAIFALITAITSTANSLLCATASHAIHDFEISRWHPHSEIAIARICTGLLGISALIASFYVTSDIIGILTKSYEFAVSVVLVPLCIGYVVPRAKKQAAYAAIIIGACGYFITNYFVLGILGNIGTLLSATLFFFIFNRASNN